MAWQRTTKQLRTLGPWLVTLPLIVQGCRGEEQPLLSDEEGSSESTGVEEDPALGGPDGLRGFGDCEAMLAWSRQHAMERLLGGELLLPEQQGGIGGTSASGGVTGIPAGTTFLSYGNAPAMRQPQNGCVTVTGAAGVVTSGGPSMFATAGADDVDPEPPSQFDNNVFDPAQGITGEPGQRPLVEDADIIKADATRMLVVTRGTLHYIDLSMGTPYHAGSLELYHASYSRGGRVLLHGTRAYIISNTFSDDVPFTHQPHSWLEAASQGRLQLLSVQEIDISNPQAMRELRTLYVQGQLLDARMSAGTARIAAHAWPLRKNLRHWSTMIDLETYFYDLADIYEPSEREAIRSRYEQQAKAAAEAYNHRILAETTVEDFLPHYVLEDMSLGPANITSGQLAQCEQALRPEHSAGVDVLSLLSINLEQGVGTFNAVPIFTTGEQLYTTDEAVYVATAPGFAPFGHGFLPGIGLVSRGNLPLRTTIHKFNGTQPHHVQYQASGSIDGRIFNHAALSDYQGTLRVAATRSDNRPFLGDNQDNFVVNLQQQGELLQEVGRLENIGSGESLATVRFVGPSAYAVPLFDPTFVYALDFSQPTAPQHGARLDLPGIARFLHPMGDGFLLSISQEYVPNFWAVRPTVSIFDLRNAGQPRRVQHAYLHGYNSPVEYDKYALTYDRRRRLAVFPVYGYYGTGDDPIWDPAESFTGSTGIWPTTVGTVGTVGTFTVTTTVSGTSSSVVTSGSATGVTATTDLTGETGALDELGDVTGDEFEGDGSETSSDDSDEASVAHNRGLGGIPGATGYSAVLELDPNHGVLGRRMIRHAEQFEDHGPWHARGAAPQRSVIVGDLVYTVSEFGIVATRLDTFEDVSVLSFLD